MAGIFADEGISGTRTKNCTEFLKLIDLCKKGWSREGLKNILRNEKYIGDALLQKTYVADVLPKKTVKNNGDTDAEKSSSGAISLIDDFPRYLRAKYK